MFNLFTVLSLDTMVSILFHHGSDAEMLVAKENYTPLKLVTLFLVHHEPELGILKLGNKHRVCM